MNTVKYEKYRKQYNKLSNEYYKKLSEIINNSIYDLDVEKGNDTIITKEK